MKELIDKQATLDAIEERAKMEVADINHFYLMGFQDAAEVVANMPEVMPGES